MNFQNKNINEPESGSPTLAYLLLGFILVGIIVYRIGTMDEVQKRSSTNATGQEKASTAEVSQTVK